MAIIDVVTCRTDGTKFAEKFPSDDLRIGTQLVVNTAQTAFLVKGGVIYDQFPPGTYTINTQNIPLLNKVLNIPFGNESPFKWAWCVQNVENSGIKTIKKWKSYL
ncbi:hypothetical protein AGMMS49982_04650 [Bacteroidia bacterium]|nr:hypothetical protein AGMMS49982_04650 [Bacteroidia bacterium]